MANLGLGMGSPDQFQCQCACHRKNRYDLLTDWVMAFLYRLNYMLHDLSVGPSRGWRMEAHSCRHGLSSVHLWMEQVRTAWPWCPGRCFLTHQGRRTVWRWHQSCIYCMWVETHTCGYGPRLCLCLGQSNKWAAWVPLRQRCVRNMPLRQRCCVALSHSPWVLSIAVMSACM